MQQLNVVQVQSKDFHRPWVNVPASMGKIYEQAGYKVRPAMAQNRRGTGYNPAMGRTAA